MTLRKRWGNELLREALAQADEETDSAHKEDEEGGKDANQARQAREGTVSTGGFEAAEAGHPTKPREFKGTKFDDKLKNLDCFLNRLKLEGRETKRVQRLCAFMEKMIKFSEHDINGPVTN
ncbi:uncharacterized protein V1513DRAFT_428025, partial [Lipomyces chichibuensis]|uniref:uncharacterized protein n=1 Tax=Lipomyces chichibuensis TaxID=1546026 RepID=UPI003343CC01